MGLRWIPWILLATTVASCDFMLGIKEDPVTKEIFEQGAIDPELIPQSVGYVPILPFWSVQEPIDVYVGYDEMVYVVNPEGLVVFDQKGTRHRTIAVEGATDVVQDRQLHTYVTGRVTRIIDGIPYRLAAVFRFVGTAGPDDPICIDTLIHPDCDVSRAITAFRGADDEAVAFTGLATLADNTLYVARRGPTNNLASVARPDNTILIFDEQGKNIGYTQGLSPTLSSLKSCMEVGAIAGFAGPPQRMFGMNPSGDFILAQQAEQAQYKVLWIVKALDAETGVTWNQNASLLNFDTTRADGFLYTPHRFSVPADVYVAPDETGYLFVVDEHTDSLYLFSPKGWEGVNPPPNSGTLRQIKVSFGGTGSGPFQFRDPSGVCSFRKTVFVADEGNNRICRYRLSTDLDK